MLPWEHLLTLASVTCYERKIFPLRLWINLGSCGQDFEGALGVIVHPIYQTTHVMFGDMPPCDQMRAKPGVIYPLLTDYHLFTMRPLVPAAKLRQVR